MPGSDEDIKIYEAPDDTRREDVSSGEDDADEFLRHKERGDFVRTWELGEAMARALLDEKPRLARDPWRTQKLTLISFLAVDTVTDTIPCHMLQRSAQDAFRKSLEALDPETFRTVTDSTAYTYFMLNDRLGGERSDGQVLAELCGEENVTLASEGDRLASRLRRTFRELAESSGLQNAQ